VNSIGKETAMIEPTLGIKFRKNTKNAQNIAKSRPNTIITQKLNIAVTELTRVLITKYDLISFLIFSKIQTI
jgi:hypothetical protein